MNLIIYYLQWIIKIPSVLLDRKEGMSIFSFLLLKISDLLRWRIIFPFSKESDKNKIKMWNKIFNRKDLPLMKFKIKEIRSYDFSLRNYLVAHSGIKSWEYSLLLSACDSFKNKKLLDIGPGRGMFHLFLKERKEADVTSLELKNPVCDSTFEELKAKSEPLGVTVKEGTVLKMPFRDDTFDIVTCISTIEHIQIDPETKKYIPYSEFIEKTRIGLKEMCRVLKKFGRLFLTTEAYIPELTGFEMAEVYNIDDINSVFIKTLFGCKMEFIGQSDYNPEKLINRKRFANYRGRYNTTFSICMEKM